MSFRALAPLFSLFSDGSADIINHIITIIYVTSQDASALKLIPGAHSVVKKDGVTHTISKYFVVPYDFDIHKDYKNNIRYTKNMDQTIRSKDDNLEEYRTIGQDVKNIKVVSEEHYQSNNEQFEENKSIDQEIVSEDNNNVTVNNDGVNLPSDVGLPEVVAVPITQSDGNSDDDGDVNGDTDGDAAGDAAGPADDEADGDANGDAGGNATEAWVS